MSMTAVTFQLNPPVSVSSWGCSTGLAMITNGGPPLELMSSADEAARAYPPMPNSELSVGGGPCDSEESVAGGGKRPRDETAGATAAGTMVTMKLHGRGLGAASGAAAGSLGRRKREDDEEVKEGDDAAEAPFQPTATFDESKRVNFAGRSFREPPASGYDVPSARPPSAVPKKQLAALRHASGGAINSESKSNVSGVQLVQWFPPVGHLIAAADLSGAAHVWDLQSRRVVASYCGHPRPVKSMQITSDGRKLSTGGLDGFLRVWDVESGTLAVTLRDTRDDVSHSSAGGDGRVVGRSHHAAPCLQHVHHPSNEQHLVLTAVGTKVLLWDLRASNVNVAREFIGHQGSILHLTCLDGGSRLLTTSEDKTIRTWDFRVPVIIKNIAGNAMHAVPHVSHHPTEPFIAAQSYDNKITVFSDDGGGKIRDVRGREFTGQTVSGTMCEVKFSSDGKFVSSGSVDGALHIWSWGTGKCEKLIKAHGQSLVSHAWHPLFPSMVATSSWDGTVKVWS